MREDDITLSTTSTTRWATLQQSEAFAGRLRPCQPVDGAASASEPKAGRRAAPARTRHLRNVPRLKMWRAPTLLLRHKAQDLGLCARPDGCAPVVAAMRCDLLARFTTQDLEVVVRSISKQHFTLAEIEGAMRIRANHGRSMKTVRDELLHE